MVPVQLMAGKPQVKPISTVLLDGQAVATWKLAHTKTGLTLTVDPFTSFPASAHPLLTNEAADIGRFLDMNVALHIEST